jgi:hypothetical protein
LIQVVVPDALYPPIAPNPPQPIPPEDQLQAGPQFVDVRVQRPGDGVAGGLDRGTAFSQPQVEISNQTLFMLVPGITGVTPNPASVAGVLTVNGTRLYHSGLKSYVLVADVAIEVVDPQPDSSSPSSTQVKVVLTAVTGANPPLTLPQTYPVRAQSNGAISVDEPSVNFT